MTVELELFPPGTLVRLKSDSSRGGSVIGVAPGRALGKRWLRIRTMSGDVTTFPEDALEAVPTGSETPASMFAEGRFTDPGWLRRTLARLRVTGRLSDMLYSMEATETNFYAHQFKPVLKMLNSPTDSLLIADEVGLGKTIEAGLIWTELRARYDFRRLLVVCPKTLCIKWKMELAHKFGVDARIVNAAELGELIVDPLAQRQGFAAIGWLQGLRPPKGWDNEGGDSSKTPRARLARLFRRAENDEPLFDLLVIDEAHYMRNPETQMHQLARLLYPVSSHRLFLSATPLHLHNQDLHALLRLLDPDTFARETTFDQILAANRPLVLARDAVLQRKFTVADVRSLIDEAARHPILKDSRQLELVKEMLDNEELDLTRRTSIAWRLEQANLLAHVVTRTRRRDVEELRVVREVRDSRLAMSPVEAEFYKAVSQEVGHYALGLAVNTRFLLSTPQRLLTSSPAAAAAYWARQKQSKAFSLDDEDELDLEDFVFDERPLVSRLSSLVRRLDVQGLLEANDTKYGELRKTILALKEQEGAAKIIVFSSFRVTLDYLRRRLTADNMNPVLLHGSVKEDRDELLTRFREDAAVDVLLSSEVGSEGIDLQFCWALVNYDIPWNPMRLEQRIGRIDRLGQKKDKVIIHNLVYEDTIDDRIYERLYKRLDLCRYALGEFEAVLGDPIRQITTTLMDPTLTPEQQEQRIEQTALALENQKAARENLEKEAAGLIAHGDFILSQIRQAHDLHRWIDSDDVLLYVKGQLARNFSGCEIEPLQPSSPLFVIRLSEQARVQFAEFIEANGLRGTTRLLSNSATRYRFTASVVRSREPHVENISQIHPLVRFAAKLDDLDTSFVRSGAVAAFLDREMAPDGIGMGNYLIGVRRWTVGAHGTGDQLGFAGCALPDGAQLSVQDAERLLNTCAAHGRPMPNAQNDPVVASASFFLSEKVFPILSEQFEAYVAQYQAETEDRAEVQLRTLDHHLAEQSRRLEAISENHRRVGKASLVAATEGRLRALKARCEQRRIEIQARKRSEPSYSEVCALFVRVV